MEDLDEFYRAYGETLATRLRAIAHATEGNTFVFCEDRGDPAEVLAALPKVPPGRMLLIWENYEEDLDTAGRDNYHSAIVGSVAVIGKALDRAAVHQTLAFSRTVALSALALMLADAQAGALYDQGIQVEVRRIPCEKIRALATSWYGYAFQFTWHVPLDLTLQPADLL